MRWADLFADLEGRAAGLAAADLDGEVAERTRIENGRLTLAARLLGATGHQVELRCAGAGSCRGLLATVGKDWLLLTESGGADLLVPAASLLSIGGLGRRSVVPAASTIELGLRSVLRRVARDRATVRALLVDGTAVAGTVDRVGVDFLEIAEHPPDQPRRPAVVTAVRAVPFGGLGALRHW